MLEVAKSPESQDNFQHVVNLLDDAKKFFLYSSMGILTTIIFWVTEMAFYYLSPHPDAKYFSVLKNKK